MNINANKDGAVYSTTNYSIFKKLLGNREDVERRGKLLMKDISERGQLIPIIVNGSMEVADGQARLFALQALGLPVRFIVAENIDAQDTIAMNTTQKQWKPDDYVQAYKDMGKEAYSYLFALRKMFPAFSYANLIAILAKTTSAGGNIVGNNSAFKSGALRLSALEYNEAVKKITFVNSVRPFFPNGGSSKTHYTLTVAILFDFDEVDNQKLQTAIGKSGYLLRPAATIYDAIASIDTCYNYRNRKCVHISELMRTYIEYQKHEAKGDKRK